MLKTMISLIKNFCFINFLVYIGYGGEGTITNAIRYGEVKHGIQLLKLMIKATLCSKLQYLTSNQQICLSDKLRKAAETVQDSVV